MITSLSQLDLSKRYSVSDYLSWRLQERVELIKGKIFKMSPAPSTNHQKISRNISKTFFITFENELCEVFSAPFDVFIQNGNKSKPKNTAVQPDIVIICDPNKIKENGCHGAPDLIVEILSPSTSKKDLSDKYDLYEEYGVKEYWVVYPEDRALMLYSLQNSELIEHKLYKYKGEVIESVCFPEIQIPIEDVFDSVRPNTILEPKPDYSRIRRL